MNLIKVKTARTGEAYLRALNHLETRSCACPDGVTRLLTFRAVTWDAYDWLHREHGRTLEEAVAFAFDRVQHHIADGSYANADFEKKLHETVADWIMDVSAYTLVNPATIEVPY